MGAVAERLAVESSTVTPLMKRLEAARLVTRARNPQDERQVRVSLTQAGRDIRQQCGCLGEALLSRSGMTPADVDGLNQQVQTLRDALQASA